MTPENYAVGLRHRTDASGGRRSYGRQMPDGPDDQATTRARTRARRAAATTLVRVRRSWRGRYELCLFAAAYLTYFGVRALTQGGVDQAVANAHDLIRLERDLGIAVEHSLQDAVLEDGWLRSAADAIYMYGHWPVLIIGGILLYRLAPPHYYRLRNVCLLSGLIGLVVFAVFPVAPPRLAGLGLVDTITQHESGYRSALPASLVNEYAAMPSFHAGWNLMLGIALFTATRNWAVRAFAVAMPLAMGFATIATANHFLVDVLAGAAIVAACFFVVARLETTMALDGRLAATDGEHDARTAVPRRPPRRQPPERPPQRGAPRHPAGRS